MFEGEPLRFWDDYRSAWEDVTNHVVPHGLSIQEIDVPPKPPLGLVPRQLVARRRALEILEAMHRYVAAEEDVPASWVEELMGRLHELA